jgi:hypothetical protein
MTLATRLVTAVFVAGSASIAFVPLASAASSAKLVPQTEAWYQPNPTCAAPTGCLDTGALPVAPPAPLPLDAVPLTPYPATTMHVGYSAGEETARTYLQLPTDSLDGTVTSAVLDVPLDVTSADGSKLPETAHLQACLYSGDITAAAGSIATPPVAACQTHAKVSYVAIPAPHLHADLTPLGAGLATTSGIVLLPDATTVTPTDAWEVVFNNHTVTGSTGPAVVTAVVEPFSEDNPAPVVDVPVDTPVDTPVQVADPPAISGGIAPGVLPEIPVSEGSAPLVQAPAAPQPQTAPVAAPRTITVGYAYPIVWLLPLVFLVIVPAVARALTRDLTPEAATS